MRSSLLPHLVAPAVSWHLGEWRLPDGTALRRPSSRIDHWDYNFPTTFVSDVRINAPMIVDACKLGAGASLMLLTVAMFSVSELPVVTASEPVDASGISTVEATLEIDPHVAGGTLTLERQIVLDEQGASPSRLAARRRGAVLLHEGSEALRVQLEGEGSRFPTELMDFEEAGIEDSSALWYLDVDTSRLDDPVSSAVRLYVNSSHPAVKRMHDADSEVGSAVSSVMAWDVARQLVRTVLTDPYFGEDSGIYEEGSVGDVVERLIQFYLSGDDVEGVRRLLNEQPGIFERRMQHATRVLRDV